ncbi:MAG: erythromycin esterase family protein, partial [Myxococcota bacterium]|nr:erythromycin esterase family protein [Myxococcota bacterium]
EEVLTLARVSREDLEEVTARERRELARREREYRGDRPPIEVAGRRVIVVDDGLATGATMRAAVAALRELGPERITVAVPVGSDTALDAMAIVADEVVCAIRPRSFRAVGEWYVQFEPTEDEEVRELLADTATTTGGRGARQASSRSADEPTISLVRAQAQPMAGTDDDFAAIAPLVQGARVVLIGEASHGTEEFYAERARMTRWLLEEQGFTDVAAEADWPDAWRLHRFLRGDDFDRSADAALGDFERFPRWMWRNTVVREFAEWLRARNDALEPGERAGFYGLDLYSLHRSMGAVIAYLDEHDPEAAVRARARYGCFDVFGDEPQMYGYATERRGFEPCEEAVIEQLREMQSQSAPVSAGGTFAEDDRFFAEQNARLARNAEGYYRSMFSGSVASWNLRDSHMAETLDETLEHLDRRRGREARIVVWAHNSHLGDARATHMGRLGEHNLGQLARERHGERAVLIGMTTHTGTVAAARDWGGDVECMRVRPSLEGSYERLFHDAGIARFLLVLRGGGEVTQALRASRLERAIGVIYRPETERQSHYFSCRLADQFDAVIHRDETRAVEPLDRIAGWETADAPETYPTGM